MKSIRYTNLYGESVTFKLYAPYIFTEVSGLAENKVNADTSKGHNQQGVYLHGVNEDGRVININGVLKAKSELEYEQKRRELIRLLNPYLGKGELIVEMKSAKYKIGAQVIGKISFERVAKTYSAEFDVIFLCPKPNWLSEVSSQIKMEDFIGGLTFPITFPIQFAQRGDGGKVFYYGDNPAPVLLDFRPAPNETSILNPTVTNDKGEYIKISKEIEAGQKVLINTDPDAPTAFLVEADGTTSRIGYVQGSTMIQLHYGENTFSFTTENGQAELYLTYNEQYAGI